MAKILDMPDSRFRTLDMRLSTPQQANRSGYAGTRQVTSNPWHGRWLVAGAHAPIIGEANILAWRGFFAELEGQAGLFRFPVGEGPQYASAVAAVVDGDNQTLPRSKLRARGFPAGDPSFPKRGQFVTIDNQLLQLTGVALDAADATVRILSFKPPLRNYAPDSVKIEAVNPYALVALPESETGYQVAAGQQYAFSLSAEEERVKPLEGYDLADDFRSRRYRVGATYKTDITALPGYSYARSGAKSELGRTGSPIAFAANAPGIVPGVGYWSRQSLTNLLLHSQSFDNAAWAKEAGATVSANAASAPDGTTTADLLTLPSGGYLYQDTTITAGATLTQSLFVRKPATGGAAAIRITSNNTLANSTGGSTKLTLTSSWQRIVLVGGVTGGGTGYRAVIGTRDAAGVADPDCVGNVEIWQGQLLAGGHPDGGPLIVTTTSAASIGEDRLSHTIDTLTDEDMLIWVRCTPHDLATTNPHALTLGTDGANQIQFYFSSGAPHVQVLAGSVFSHAATSAVPVATGDELSIVLRRHAGAWRSGVYKGGTLTWSSAGNVGAFPAGISTVFPGTFRLAGNPLRGIVHGPYIRPGTFSADAAVIAAVEAG
ncbi:MAG: hypothetical protein M3N07_03475 [Pseudomonadota bacterium]|nr:hypothetical protein [Pseudomonadota bacterium]